MKLHYLASATVIVEHAGTRILCDPWLTEGVYGGAWYHTPPLTVTPEDVADVDGIYISHIHPDHCDLATLKRLPRTIPVYIGQFIEPFLGAMLRGLGFTVHELPMDQAVELAPGFTIQIIPADACDPQACGQFFGCALAAPAIARPGSYQLDTLAVFQGGGHTIVNVNDVPYALAGKALAKVKAIAPRIDLLLVGYAGAGPWPQCFPDLTPEEMRAAADAKQVQFLGQMRAFVDALEPERFMPFAGTYRLGGPLAHLNEWRGVPERWELAAEHFDERMLFLAPNRGEYDCARGEHKFFKQGLLSPRQCRERERENRVEALDHEADEWPTFTELVRLGNASSAAWATRCAARGYVPSQAVLILARTDSPDERHWPSWLATPEHVPDDAPCVVIELDARLLKRILTRQFHWNNAEIGSLLTIRTVPKGAPYDRALWHHLSFLHV